MEEGPSIHESCVDGEEGEKGWWLKAQVLMSHVLMVRKVKWVGGGRSKYT